MRQQTDCPRNIAIVRPVTLLTDFGILDDFAGVCHGVIVARAPGCEVIHVTHGITPQNVLQGARVLRDTLPYLPVGVHVAVVDPGVGTTRRCVAVQTSDDRIFVGPDNGLLTLAIAACGGADRVVSLEAEAHRILPVSDTFHGRDIFAPAAAFLAQGGSLEQLGPAVDPAELVAPQLPSVDSSDGEVHAEVWNVDRFGNASLWLSERELTAALGDVDAVEIAVGADRYRYIADVVRTFANVRPGGLLVYVDAYDGISIAVNQGHAADMLRVRPGSGLTLARLDDRDAVPAPSVATASASM